MSVTDLRAPTCIAALHEASSHWPGRSILSDGILPSAEHHFANPGSDHERGNAFDLTHDPAAGLDSYALAEWLRARCAAGLEHRPTYVISARRIARARTGWAWERYTGDSPHLEHMHVSIRPELRSDVNAWWTGATGAVAAHSPTHTTEEDPMPLVITTPDGKALVVLDPATTRLQPIGSGEAWGALLASGVRYANGGRPSQAQWDALRAQSKAAGGWG